jgi:hypothetical protein
MCRGCGQPLTAGADVCNVCGVRAVTAPATAPPIPEQPIPEQPPPEHATPEPERSAPANGSSNGAVTAEQIQQIVHDTLAHDAPAPVRRVRPVRRFFVSAATGLVVVLIMRIVLAAAGGEETGELVAQLPVGPDGAKTTFDDGGKISIPKGALEKKETITIRRNTVRERIRAVGPDGASIIVPPGTQVVYVFGPTNLVFLRPVTIVLPAPPPPATGLIFVAADGSIRFFPAVQNGGFITFRITSFDFSRPNVFVNIR